jgi:hypothetical protein
VLFMSHLIRARLKAKHPQIYAKLGSPAFNDSNLRSTYWKFSGFVCWGTLRMFVTLQCMPYAWSRCWGKWGFWFSLLISSP